MIWNIGAVVTDLDAYCKPCERSTVPDGAWVICTVLKTGKPFNFLDWMTFVTRVLISTSKFALFIAGWMKAVAELTRAPFWMAHCTIPVKPGFVK